MISVNELELLHRHGSDWTPLAHAEHDSTDHDLERRLARGDRLYECTECDLQILVVPPDET